MGGHTLGKELSQALFVGLQRLGALGGDAADGVRQPAQAASGHFDVTGLPQCLDLDAHVASGGVRDLTEIHEVGALETVEGYHDFQPEFVVEQRVDDRKLKCHGS